MPEKTNKKRLSSIFLNGIFTENPTLRLVLGVCPTLAVSTSAQNAIGLGVATTFVLIGSNAVISLLRNFIPDKVRIPAFIIVISTFVTVVQMLMRAYFLALNESLGIFLPLIVVNCIILARAEAFASKNSVVASAADGLGMGIGFTLAITLLGALREILGAGTVFGISVLGASYDPMRIAVLAPGGFILLGLLLGLVNALGQKAAQRKKQKEEGAA